MKILLLSLSIVICVFGLGQEWQLLKTSYTHYYRHSDSLHITNVISVDSLEIVGPDTTYHLNRSIKKCDTCVYNYQLYYGYAKEFLGYNYSYENNSGGYTIENDSLFTTKDLGNSWSFNGSVNATITTVSDSILFGTLDSIKVISLSTLDTIIISKSTGILRYPDFDHPGKYFILVGIQKDDISLGEYLPNVWSIYDFVVGDVFCFNIDSWSVDNNNVYNHKIEILEDLSTQGYFKYLYKTLGYNHSSYGWSNPPPTEWNSTSNFTDTFKLAIGPNNLENCKGGIQKTGYLISNYESFYNYPFAINPFDSLNGSNWNEFIASQWKYDPDYGYISNITHYEPYTDSLFFVSNLNDVFISFANNLGRIKVHWFDFEYLENELLQGFHTNSGSFGISCNYPNDLSANQFIKSNFSLNPNPAINEIYFSELIKEIQFYSLDGKLILSSPVENYRFEFNLESGMYIILMKNEDGSSFQEKLVVN
ncbi:MAG: T9SS type A sorting domain-containing protein [Crocinitomicaceae bacterium]|nr:T9SS type A sorting domain-containing protein [Crocinitomicaceae bacterium]